MKWQKRNSSCNLFSSIKKCIERHFRNSAVRPLRNKRRDGRESRWRADRTHRISVWEQDKAGSSPKFWCIAAAARTKTYADNPRCSTDYYKLVNVPRLVAPPEPDNRWFVMSLLKYDSAYERRILLGTWRAFKCRWRRADCFTRTWGSWKKWYRVELQISSNLTSLTSFTERHWRPNLNIFVILVHLCYIYRVAQM